MNFSQLEEEYQRLKGQFEAGTLTEEDFKVRLKELMIQDGEGRWWMIGYETGQWFVHDGENWVRSEPPHDAEPPRDKGGPKKPTLRTSGRQKVLIGGCVLGGFAGFLILIGLLVDTSQPDRSLSQAAAVQDDQQDTQTTTTAARMETSVARTEIVEARKEEAKTASDLVAAIDLVAEAESQARLSLDETSLYEIFTGEALKREIAEIEYLREEGIFVVANRLDIQYGDYFVSDDGMRGQVHVTPTWDTTYLSIETGECIGWVPPHDVPQTIYLERGSTGWMVYDIEFDIGPLDVEPC